MFRIVCSIIATSLVLQTGFAAPGPKETDKPDGPATTAQKIKAMNNLKQIGLGLHNYHDRHNAFPTNTQTKDGKPGLSWRVLILPYLEEGELFKQFKLDEPWDSANNSKLIEKMPKVYTPVRGKAAKGQTFLQCFVGANTLMGDSRKGIRLADITDGTSNTFMVTEGGTAVDWTKPDDLPFDDKTLPKLGGMFDGEFNVLMGDGSVRRVPKGIDAGLLKPFISRNGGEVADLGEVIKNATDK